MPRITTRRASLVSALAAVALLSGCASASTPQPDPADGAVPAYAFITGDISDFGQVQIEGMESVVEPLGGSITVFDGGSTAEDQNDACMDVVTSGRYNGLILNAASAPGGVPCVDAAHAAGIPVAAIETPVGPDATVIEPQMEGVVVSAGFSNEAYGSVVADLVELGCAEFSPCNYLVVVGTPAYPVSAAALDELEARFGDDPDYVQLAVGEDGFNPEEGRQVAADLIAANPQVNVIINSSDSSAVQVAQLLDELGRTDVINLGDGGSRQGLAAVADGGIFATSMIKPFTMGEVSAQALVDHAAGGEIPTPAEVAELVTPSIVTGGNVADFEGQWG